MTRFECDVDADEEGALPTQSSRRKENAETDDEHATPPWENYPAGLSSPSLFRLHHCQQDMNILSRQLIELLRGEVPRRKVERSPSIVPSIRVNQKSPSSEGVASSGSISQRRAAYVRCMPTSPASTRRDRSDEVRRVIAERFANFARKPRPNAPTTPKNFFRIRVTPPQGTPASTKSPDAPYRPGAFSKSPNDSSLGTSISSADTVDGVSVPDDSSNQKRRKIRGHRESLKVEVARLPPKKPPPPFWDSVDEFGIYGALEQLLGHVPPCPEIDAFDPMRDAEEGRKAEDQETQAAPHEIEEKRDELYRVLLERALEDQSIVPPELAKKIRETRKKKYEEAVAETLRRNRVMMIEADLASARIEEDERERIRLEIERREREEREARRREEERKRREQERLQRQKEEEERKKAEEERREREKAEAERQRKQREEEEEEEKRKRQKEKEEEEAKKRQKEKEEEQKAKKAAEESEVEKAKKQVETPSELPDFVKPYFAARSKFIEYRDTKMLTIKRSTDAEVRAKRMEVRRNINGSINQLASNKRQIATVSLKIVHFLSSIKDNTDVFEFAAYTLAMTCVDAAESQMRTDNRTVWPMAFMLQRILKVCPQIREIVMGVIVDSCTYTIPYLMPKPKTMSLEDFKKSRGQRTGENEEEFFMRMVGILRLRLAICVAEDDMETFWQWMTRLLVSQPVRRVTPFLIATALEVGGFFLCRASRKQALKLLEYIKKYTYPLLQQKLTQPSSETAAALKTCVMKVETQLTELISTTKTSSTIRACDGFDLPESAADVDEQY